MVEVWKDIVDYEGKYQVSNMGRVKSLVDRWGRKREMILKLSVNNKNGYVQVNLHKDSKQKTYRVHKLVALAFVDGYEEGLVVNHIDECKDNNVWTNLEWVTTTYNNTYNDRHKRAGNSLKGIKRSDETKKKLSKIKSKKVMCVETEEVFESLTKAGEFIGVTRQAIAHSIKKEKSCKGYHWQYVK